MKRSFPGIWVGERRQQLKQTEGRSQVRFAVRTTHKRGQGVTVEIPLAGEPVRCPPSLAPAWTSLEAG